MARPRKDQEGPTAVERMEEAFWEILAEKPYAQIGRRSTRTRSTTTSTVWARSPRKRWTTCSHARWRACC